MRNGRLGALGVTRDDGDVRAALEERLGEGRAEACGPAGDVDELESQWGKEERRERGGGGGGAGPTLPATSNLFFLPNAIVRLRRTATAATM